MSIPLPTEAQCLATRVHHGAQQLTTFVATLPQQLAAVDGWQDNPALEAFCRSLAEQQLQARTLEFDAERLRNLVDDHNDDARLLYSLTMQLVEAARMARGSYTAPGVAVLANAVESALADMQRLIAAAFPGETIISD